MGQPDPDLWPRTLQTLVGHGALSADEATTFFFRWRLRERALLVHGADTFFEREEARRLCFFGRRHPLEQNQTVASSTVDLTTGEYRVVAGLPCESKYTKLPWNLYEDATELRTSNGRLAEVR